MNRCRYNCPPCSPTRYGRHVSGTCRPMLFSHLGPVSSLAGPSTPSNRNLTLKKACGEAGGPCPRAPAGAGPQARGRACKQRQHSSWQGVRQTWRRKDKTLRTTWQRHGPWTWQGHGPNKAMPYFTLPPDTRTEGVNTVAPLPHAARPPEHSSRSDPRAGDSCGHAVMPRPWLPRPRRDPPPGAQLPKSTYFPSCRKR